MKSHPFGPLRRWRTAAVSLLGLLAVGGLAWGFGALPAILALVFFVATGLYVNIGSTDKSRVEAHAYWTAGLHFTVTFAGAAAYAAVTWKHRATGDDVVWADVLQDLMLSSAFIGGLLALVRSTRTNSYSLATLNELGRLRDQMRRRDDLLELGSEAALSTSPEMALSFISRMVEDAVDPAAMHPDGGALSVWYRGPERWEIIASKGLSEATRGTFFQERVDTETPGAGVVANMAATGTSRLVEANVVKHPWYKADPDKAGGDGSMAAALVYDPQREPIGAVCFTSDHPISDGGGVQRVLLMWEIAFTMPLTVLSRWEKVGGEDG